MQIWTSCIGQRLDGAENTRTMVLCDTLLQRGHAVTLWTSAFDHIRKCWRPEWEEHGEAGYRMENGLLVKFMKGCGYRSNVGIRRLVDHVLAARDLRRQAAGLAAPDAVVASLPDHVTAAEIVAIGRERGAATIIDVRDKWPDIFIDYAPTLPLKLLVRSALWREIARARRALAAADSLVAMMDSMLEWGLRRADRAKRDSDRVFFLTTTPRNFGPERGPVTSSQATTLAGQVSGKLVFTFVGTFNRTQHPSLMLDAIDLLREDPAFDMNQVAFVIGGTGTEEIRVQERSAQHPNVHYLGWLKTDAMLDVLSLSDVGMLMMNFSSPAFNNKAFAYLASGLPIINGATGDLADLIDRHDVGINVPGGNAAAVADAIRTLAADPAALHARQHRVRALFDANFDRSATYTAYAEHIEEVTRRRSSLR